MSRTLLDGDSLPPKRTREMKAVEMTSMVDMARDIASLVGDDPRIATLPQDGLSGVENGNVHAERWWNAQGNPV